MFANVIYSFFILDGVPTNYNPVEAYEGEIRYVIPPKTEYINTLALRNANLAGQYGIYVDNFLTGMNDDRIMRVFSDVHNPYEAVRRYMYILLWYN
ncbi:hypothetical protein [Xenorhabdus ehlersii]|uniref:Uncharacterized protein n=1 Tax=Xenorhabdus ehlersii TaxID=290111 RepID=A0A2D0IK53_9GAMM|nr:hypothetical protein [Xenorhabdus ehlersii]PHM22151.1 hypothetical protein Xehl_03904 [Xenorhabdus ehlersii]RKE91200.1 hypothetical protein BDE27_1409 [Xenorhabdus ehlersii]